MSEPGLGEPVPLRSLARVTTSTLGVLRLVEIWPDDSADLPALRGIVTAGRLRHFLGLWLEAEIDAMPHSPAPCLGFALWLGSNAGALPEVIDAINHFPIAPEALTSPDR